MVFIDCKDGLNETVHSNGVGDGLRNFETHVVFRVGGISSSCVAARLPKYRTQRHAKTHFDAFSNQSNVSPSVIKIVSGSVWQCQYVLRAL